MFYGVLDTSAGHVPMGFHRCGGHCDEIEILQDSVVSRPQLPSQILLP